MSAAKGIFALGMTIFWAIMAVWFGSQFIGSMQEVLEGPEEDAYYESYGCYISDGGNMYTCPNGSPPDPDANPEIFNEWKQNQ